jgi:hypothetical protein
MIRVVARGKSGLVILRNRKPDGSYVLLQCEEFQPTGGGGIIGEPDDEEEEEFPMLHLAERRLRRHADRTGAEPFSLEVDITTMEPGELRFHNREFIEQAIEHAYDGEVAITPANAEEWGFIGRNRTRED